MKTPIRSKDHSKPPGFATSVRIKDALLCTVLAAGGVALRVPLLGRGFWRDEGATYFDIAPRSFGAVIAATNAHELTPPAYFTLVWAWANAFGTSEVALHAFSLVWCAVAIVAAYALGNVLGGRYAGIALAACVAIAPLSLDIGMEARPYAMVIALATLTLYASFRNRTLVFALAALLLGLTHFTAIVFTGILAVAALCTTLVRRERVWLLIAIAFAITLIDAAWVHVAMQDHARILPWNGDAAGGILAPLDDGLNYFAPFGTMIAQTVRLFEAVLFVWIVTRLWWRRFDARDSAIAICAALTIGGVLFTYLSHTPGERHLAIFAPAAWCCAVLLGQWTIEQLRALRGTAALIVRTLTLLVCAYIGIAGAINYPRIYRSLLDPISGAHAAVAAELQHPAHTLVAAPAFLGWSLGYYLQRAGAPALAGIPGWDDPERFIPDASPPATLLGAIALAAAIDAHGPQRIALFHDPTPGTQPLDLAGQRIYDGLLRSYRVTWRKEFAGRREPVELILLQRR